MIPLKKIYVYLMILFSILLMGLSILLVDSFNVHVLAGIIFVVGAYLLGCGLDLLFFGGHPNNVFFLKK